MHSPKSLKVEKELLKGTGLSQRELSKKAGVSIGQVNKVISKLKNSFLVDFSDTGISLRDPNRLLLPLGTEYPMSGRLYKQLVSLKPQKETKVLISKQLKKIPYAFTLLAALPKYSYAASGEKVSLYIEKKHCEKAVELLKRVGFSDKNNGVVVEIYVGNEGILYDAVNLKDGKYVSREQLLIDFYSSPQYNYVANQLLQEYLRGKK